MTNLMGLATKVPPVAHVALSIGVISIGLLVLLVAIWRLVRGAHRLSSLQLAPGHVGSQTKKEKDVPMNNVNKN